MKSDIIYLKSCDLIGSSLAVIWSDGLENFIDLSFLRKNCPCAICQGESDVFGKPDFRFSEVAKNNEISSLDLVGSYGLKIVWKDLHQSGIYSFALLRKLGKHSVC